MLATMATAVARTNVLDALALFLYGIWSWIRGNVLRAVCFGLVSMAVAFAFNVVLIAFVHNGEGSVPAGSPALTSQNTGSGALFWVLAPMIVAGLISYRLQVGGKRFWTDLRGFPVSVAHLARRGRLASVEQMLWGFAVAMVVSAALSPAVALFVAAGTLALAGQLLRPLAGALLSSVWRTFVRRIAPARGRPPGEAALLLSLVGSFLALLAGLLLGSGVVKIVFAIIAAAAALMVNRRQPVPVPAVAALLLIAWAAWLLTGMPHPAYACDGGFSECGGNVADWLNCGAGPVLSQAALASILAGPSGVIGAGAGGFDPSQWQNPIQKAYATLKAQNPQATPDDFWNLTADQRAREELQRYEAGQGQADVANLERLANAPGQVWQGFKGGAEGLAFTWNFFTSADPQYQALRNQASVGAVAEGAVDTSWQATDQAANSMFRMSNALRSGDANTVQQMLNEFGGNMLFQAATGKVSDTLIDAALPSSPAATVAPATYVGADGVRVTLPDAAAKLPDVSATTMGTAESSTTAVVDSTVTHIDAGTTPAEAGASASPVDASTSTDAVTDAGRPADAGSPTGNEAAPSPQADSASPPAPPAPTLKETMGSTYDYVLNGTGSIPSIAEVKASNLDFATIPDDNLVAIRGITRGDYQPLNNALRTGDQAALRQYQSYIQNAQDGLSQLPDYQGTVYRGTDLTDAALQKFIDAQQSGIAYEDPAFVHATADASRQYGGGFNNNVNFVIDSTTGKLVEPVSQWPGEQEVMFQPGTKFNVLDVVQRGPNDYTITLSQAADDASLVRSGVADGGSVPAETPEPQLPVAATPANVEVPNGAPTHPADAHAPAPADAPGAQPSSSVPLGPAPPPAPDLTPAQVEHVWDTAVRTPTGIAFVDATNAEQAAHLSEAQQLPKTAEYVMAGHGSPYAMVIGDAGGNLQVSPRQMAGFLSDARSGWIEGQPIRLASCHTGLMPDGFGQQLSNELGVPVRAPDGLLYTPPGGDPFVVKPVQVIDPDSGQIVTVYRRGGWNSFLPGGRGAP
ncbi:MAG: ADP-ribosyltransferase [Candidatus Dormibacteria bacterium]